MSSIQATTAEINLLSNPIIEHSTAQLQQKIGSSEITPIFDVHTELERWIKKQDVDDADIDPLSVEALVHIFVESHTDVRYQLNEKTVSLLVATLDDRLSDLNADAGLSYEIEKHELFKIKKKHLASLQKISPTTIVKALSCFISQACAEDIITALKQVLLSQDENQITNLSKLTAEELTQVCSLFYVYIDNDAYEVAGLYKEVVRILKEQPEKLLQTCILLQKENCPSLHMQLLDLASTSAPYNLSSLSGSQLAVLAELLIQFQLERRQGFALAIIEELLTKKKQQLWQSAIAFQAVAACLAQLEAKDSLRYMLSFANTQGIDFDSLFHDFENALNQTDDLGKTKLEKLTMDWNTLQILTQLFSKSKRKSETLLAELSKRMKPYGIVSFEFACGIGLENLALKLISQGLDTKKTNQFKSTALHIAVHYQLEQVVNKLLAICPSDVNKANRGGHTPLHASCNVYNIPITALLLTHKADPAKRNHAGQTAFWIPFSKLARKNEAENLKIVQFYSQFFHSFDQIVAHLQQINCHSLLDFFNANSEFVFYKQGPETNPLETAFVLSYLPLSQKIYSQLTEAKAKVYADALIQKYPHAKDTTLGLLYWNACQKKQSENAISFAEQMSIQALNTCTAFITAFKYKLPQVVEMLCTKGVDVNCSDTLGDTPLHIACKKGYLCTAENLLRHNANLTRKNSSGETAFQSMLTSKKWQKNRQKMQKYLKHFFTPFPALVARIEQFQGLNFSQHFTNSLELLLQEPHVQNTANPLFVPLVFNDLSLAKALFTRMGETSFQNQVALLKMQYPGTDFDSLEFAGYELNRQHMRQDVPGDIPDKPKDAVPEEMLAFFNDVNFQDSKKMPYFDPETYGLHFKEDQTFAEQLNSGFLKVIKEQKVTMPPPNLEARKKFYRDVENTLCLTIRTVTTTIAKATLLGDCTKLIGICAGGILPVCMNLYNEYVKGIPATFEPALFEKLGNYRKMLLESLLPPGQDTHHFLMLFYVLSKKEELNLPYAKAAYDDRVAAANAVDVEATKVNFYRKYVPSQIIPYIEQQIEQDGEFRKRYIDYWKKQLPDTWRDVVYESLETAKLNRQLIIKTLKQQKVLSCATTVTSL